MTSASAPSPSEGELGLITVRVNHKLFGSIVPEDGSGRRFQLYLTPPSLLSEPYVVADEKPGEYRVFVPGHTTDKMNIKLMARDPVTGPYAKRGPAEDEYHLHIM